MNLLPSDLTPEALALLDSRPENWEYRLFAQILIDEVGNAQRLKVSPPLGSRHVVPLSETPAWLQARMSALKTICHDLMATVNANHEDAFGPTGQDGDPSAIAAFARRLARLYRQAIEWVQSVRFAEVEPSCRSLAYEMSFMANTVLTAVEQYGPDLKRQLEAASQLPAGSHVRITAKLTLEAPNADRIFAAFADLESSIQPGLVARDPISLSAAGWVYILRNDSMPGLLKIGHTSRSPHERLSELSTATGVPTPFVLAFDAYVDHSQQAEADVHRRLAFHRLAANREFFNVDLDTAIAAVIQAQQAVAVSRHTANGE
jgi:hypothetical protein